MLSTSSLYGENRTPPESVVEPSEVTETDPHVAPEEEAAMAKAAWGVALNRLHRCWRLQGGVRTVAGQLLDGQHLGGREKYLERQLHLRGVVLHG